MVKNLHCERETWRIGLQDRTTDLDLGEPRKKSGEGYCEVFTSRTTRQQDEGFLSYARQLFPNYNFFSFFFMFMILQILTSVKEIALVT